MVITREEETQYSCADLMQVVMQVTIPTEVCICCGLVVRVRKPAASDLENVIVGSEPSIVCLA